LALDYQKLLLEHLELVDRVVRYIARKHHLPAPDTEELLSLVRLRLLDRDFAVLRKFQGRSNLATYLTTVIEHIYLDFCVGKWGKWRPSAAARRLGPIAILLDQLVGRDGLTFNEAVSTLEINYGVSETRDDLHAIFVQLPTRTVRRFAAEEELAVVAGHVGARDAALEREDDLEVIDRVESALSAILAGLAPREQLMLKLRFQDGLSMAAIARFLHTPAKPLYRHLETTIAFLRDKLRQQGIEAKDIDRIVGHPALTLGRVLSEPFDCAQGKTETDSGERDDGSV
jgi:RNA polymerase sigma factor for flagellar operon FliA